MIVIFFLHKLTFNLNWGYNKRPVNRVHTIRYRKFVFKQHKLVPIILKRINGTKYHGRTGSVIVSVCRPHFFGCCCVLNYTEFPVSIITITIIRIYNIVKVSGGVCTSVITLFFFFSRDFGTAVIKVYTAPPLGKKNKKKKKVQKLSRRVAVYGTRLPLDCALTRGANTRPGI